MLMPPIKECLNTGGNTMNEKVSESGRSKTDFSKVLQTLSPPSLPEAVGGRISLANVPPQGATIVVPEYEGIRKGDLVTIRFGYAGDDFFSKLKIQ
jgi:hypothetical protein